MANMIGSGGLFGSEGLAKHTVKESIAFKCLPAWPS